MSDQLQLFAETVGASGDFVWQWHGRQVLTELRNDFRWPRKLHRVVYHLADVCDAPNEAAATSRFRGSHPDAQTVSLFCVGPARPKGTGSAQ